MLARCALPFGPPNLQLGMTQTVGPTVPIFELQTGPTDYMLLMSVEGYRSANNSGGVSFPLGLGAPAVKGIGILSSPSSNDDASRMDSASGCQFFTQWTRPPTAPTTYLRRMVSNPSGAGGALIGTNSWFYFDFPNGLKIGPSSSLVLFSTATNIGNPNFGFGDLSVTVDC